MNAFAAKNLSYVIISSPMMILGHVDERKVKYLQLDTDCNSRRMKFFDGWQLISMNSYWFNHSNAYFIWLDI